MRRKIVICCAIVILIIAVVLICSIFCKKAIIERTFSVVLPDSSEIVCYDYFPHIIDSTIIAAKVIMPKESYETFYLSAQNRYETYELKKMDLEYIDDLVLCEGNAVNLERNDTRIDWWDLTIDDIDTMLYYEECNSKPFRRCLATQTVYVVYSDETVILYMYFAE